MKHPCDTAEVHIRWTDLSGPAPVHSGKKFEISEAVSFTMVPEIFGKTKDQPTKRTGKHIYTLTWVQ